jgi:hypothetical protein
MKKSVKAEPKAVVNVAKSNQFNPFSGGGVVTSRAPSGVKCLFEADDDAILVFIGTKDISDKLGKGPGEVVYNIFHDGRRFISMPMSYSLAEITFEENAFYYLHHQGDIVSKAGFNPMKDFLVIRLGKENETLKCEARISDAFEFTLTLPNIAEVNYTRLNYPLRDKR